MSETIATRSNTELKRLDASWAPWVAQIVNWVSDGASYDRPGQRTCTGWSNFETMEAAQRAFDR